MQGANKVRWHEGNWYVNVGGERIGKRDKDKKLKLERTENWDYY
jgi:hypothetical protein